MKLLELESMNIGRLRCDNVIAKMYNIVTIRNRNVIVIYGNKGK